MNSRNKTMSILTGIAIILVVLGHLDWKILSFGGVFPYYGYHVMIFVFVSGYFYKPEDEEHIGAYLLRKVKRLLIPYFIWNLIYGVISTILATQGFIFCNRISIYSFFVEPFLGGHQYGLNFAAWFVPALFIVETVNILMRKLAGLIKLKYEWLFTAMTLIVGIAVVFFAKGGHVWGYYKTPGRILFMLPVFQFGQFYKIYLEKRDNLRFYIYFPVVIALQLIAYFVSDGALNFSAVWCTSFGSFSWMPYFTTAIGIAFWLRISRMLSNINIGKWIAAVGDGSFDIMMHHVTVFFLINLITLAICRLGNAVGSFDIVQFKENINYVYLLGGYSIWKSVYAILGIILPILLGKTMRNINLRFKKS